MVETVVQQVVLPPHSSMVLGLSHDSGFISKTCQFSNLNCSIPTSCFSDSLLICLNPDQV